MKDMLAELNQMLEQRERGEEPDFEGFMERFGDFFPGNPQTLDELLEQMAQSMAQMQQLLNSMSPEQRAQLQELANALLDDMDLRWQMDQLGQNLRNAFPQMGWGQRMGFRGDEPLPLDGHGRRCSTSSATSTRSRTSCATRPTRASSPRSTSTGSATCSATTRRVRCSSSRSSRKMLEEAGPHRAARRAAWSSRRRASAASASARSATCSAGCCRTAPAATRSSAPGFGHERSNDHKTYEFGDPFHLDVARTIKNAITRGGSGTPVRITPEDFEIERTEQVTRSRDRADARRLALDGDARPLPRGEEGRDGAARARSRSQFPRDYLGMVSFGRVAREVKPERLPEATWDFEWGTNMQHALALARKMLSSQSGRKQIIMITDGEPTAHIEDGYPYFDYPPSPRTIEMTLREVQRCTQRRHPHQHVHARGELLPPRLRRAHDEDEPGPRVLHDARDPRRLRARRLPRGQARAAPRPADAPASL